MFKLQFKRCIQSVYGWFDAGEFASLDQCVNQLYNTYWLDARVYGPAGEVYSISEHEFTDADGCDCVSFSFVRS